MSISSVKWERRMLEDRMLSSVPIFLRKLNFLHVGLVHAALFTQYIAFKAFPPNWLPEGSTFRYTCKEEQISSQG